MVRRLKGGLEGEVGERGNRQPTSSYIHKTRERASHAPQTRAPYWISFQIRIYVFWAVYDTYQKPPYGRCGTLPRNTWVRVYGCCQRQLLVTAFPGTHSIQHDSDIKHARPPVLSLQFRCDQRSCRHSRNRIHTVPQSSYQLAPSSI